MRDTASAAEQVRLDALRRLDPIERLAQALAWSESVREVALRRLRDLHPGRPESELAAMIAGIPSTSGHLPRPGE